MAEDRWKEALPHIAQARQKILDDQNIIGLFARVAKDALARPVPEDQRAARPVIILSEKLAQTGHSTDDGRAGLVFKSNLRLWLVRVRKSSFVRVVTNPATWVKTKLRLAASKKQTKKARQM